MTFENRYNNQSVFDRLLDYEPDLEQDHPISVSQHIRMLKENLRRDMEVLLNTQPPLYLMKSDLDEIQNSLVQYGTPSFHSMILATKQQQSSLKKKIKSLISTFEPRLKNIDIDIVDNRNQATRLLKLKIKAAIEIDGSKQVVEFDTILDSTLRHFKLQNGKV